MALTLGAKIGDVVDVAAHWIALLSIDGRHNATLIRDNELRAKVEPLLA